MANAALADMLQEAPTAVSFRPLAPALGAEILGVDLRRPLDRDMVSEIREIWKEGLVILLRDQAIDEDDQVNFARCFGPLNESRKQRAHHNASNPAVMWISNIRENGRLVGALPDGEMHFHTDQSHQETPCSATMLHALEVPSTGGDTLFANCYMAYETLPGKIKAKIEGRTALNGYDYDNASTRRGTVLGRDVPRASHPIVRTHPETGRKALYVNRLMTLRIDGMDEAESDELLAFLFDHAERPEFVYRHCWRPNDLLMWDNRCTLHARTDFSAAERRLMRRVTIMGERPY